MLFGFLFVRGRDATQKTIEALRALRRLLSKSEVPPIEAAIQEGAVPLLVQCLSFGSADEQVYIIYNFSTKVARDIKKENNNEV